VASLAAEPTACEHCGGAGRRLRSETHYCSNCRWLRPLAPGFRLPLEAFLWSLDAQAMAALAAIAPLKAAAQALSDRIGRPWLEATINGVRLGPDQLPIVFQEAVGAARVLGLQRMPDVYLAGDVGEPNTLGSDTSAFVVLPTSLADTPGEERKFLLGREMGRVAAGHALWRSVLQVLSGKSQDKAVLGQGILAFMNPTKFVESAVQAPLMAWARQSEITADRAGLLLTGRYDVARKAILLSSLKSKPLYDQLNIDAFEQQLLELDELTSQISEWTMSATPYLGRRLRLVREHCHSDLLIHWRRTIEPLLPTLRTS
jgi:Zn-dependent protease with chaperone function